MAQQALGLALQWLVIGQAEPGDEALFDALRQAVQARRLAGQAHREHLQVDGLPDQQRPAARRPVVAARFRTGLPPVRQQPGHRLRMLQRQLVGAGCADPAIEARQHAT